jgi:hypothetical protein
MSYRARKFWSAMALVIGLPAYVVVAVTVVGLFERPSLWVEFAVYLALGVVWALPLRRLFLGIGRPDPDATPRDGPPQV